MTKTELRLQYGDRTKHFELPEPIEIAIENDYVIYHDLYTDDMLGYIRLLYDLHQNITAQEIIKHVHKN